MACSIEFRLKVVAVLERGKSQASVAALRAVGDEARINFFTAYGWEQKRCKVFELRQLFLSMSARGTMRRVIFCDRNKRP